MLTHVVTVKYVVCQLNKGDTQWNKICQSCGIILDGNLQKKPPGLCGYCVEERKLKQKKYVQPELQNG
jgi:hypothetical protein